MRDIRLSVITVCFNAVDTIEKTICSVVNQSYPNIEFIVIDGGSTDGTVELINKYAKDIDYFVSEPDNGIYDAMNKGIKAATGDWLIFINAGDCFHGNFVAESFCKVANLSYDIIYGSIIKVLKDIHYRYDPYPLEMMDKCMTLPHQATFIKTAFHKKHLFDTSYHSSGDYHFFYNAYYNYGAHFHQIDLVVADFDETCGMSKENIKTARLEDLRIWDKEKSLYPAIRIRLRIVYWKLTNTINNFLSKSMQVKWRNYKLRRQGYKLIKNC